MFYPCFIRVLSSFQPCFIRVLSVFYQCFTSVLPVCGCHLKIYPPFTRGRFWPDRGSVMSWHLGRNVESKNIFGFLKIRFEGVGYEIFGGRLWKNRTRGVGYEILVVDFQNFWLGGSVMRFLWFGFEKFWLWGVCYEIVWFEGRFWKFYDVGGRFWDYFILRGRFWEILRKSGFRVLCQKHVVFPK